MPRLPGSGTVAETVRGSRTLKSLARAAIGRTEMAGTAGTKMASSKGATKRATLAAKRGIRTATATLENGALQATLARSGWPTCHQLPMFSASGVYVQGGSTWELTRRQ